MMLLRFLLSSYILAGAETLPFPFTQLKVVNSSTAWLGNGTMCRASSDEVASFSLMFYYDPEYTRLGLTLHLMGSTSYIRALCQVLHILPAKSSLQRWRLLLHPCAFLSCIGTGLYDQASSLPTTSATQMAFHSPWSKCHYVPGQHIDTPESLL